MPPHLPSENHTSIIGRVPFFYGFIILAVSALAIFVSGPGQTYSVSIFVDPIIKEFGWSRTLVSGLYTGGSLTAGVLMILVGRLLDKYGARIMITVAGILFGLAALWMGSVDSPLKLYVGFAAIRTLGQGSLTLIPTTLIALWFIRLRGRVTAIGVLGGAISAAVFPILIHNLITNMDWQGAWQVLAYIIWGALLIPAVFLIRRSPESVGLLPDGRPPIAEDNEEKSRVIDEVNFTLSEALKTRTFWLLLFASAAQPLIGTALAFHQISLLGSRGISAGMAASVFSFIAPAQILGTFSAGFLADKYPNRYLLVIGQGVLILAMLLTFIISAPWQAFLYGAVNGFGAGFIMTVGSVIWPNYFGRMNLGSIRGVAMAGMVIFAALGPLPFGLIFDLTDSYSLAILIFLALPVSCAVAALLARPPRRREME